MTEETKSLVTGLLAAHLRNLKLAPSDGMACSTLVRELWHGDRRVQIQVKLVSADPNGYDYLEPEAGNKPEFRAEALRLLAQGEDCE